MNGLGSELPQRMTYVWILLAAALVFVVPCVRTARRAASESGSTAWGWWAMAAVMVLVLVVAPLMIARGIHNRHTYLTDETVTVTSGDEVRQRIDFADVEEVRVRYSGRGGDTFRNEKVFLVGRLGSGERGTVMVARMHVETLQPLLRRLAQEIEERPGLLASNVDREYFGYALANTP